MNDNRAEVLLKRFNKAESRKTNWRDIYENAMEYVSPQREVFDEEFKGQERSGENRVFDSTGIEAHMRFASNLQASLVPPMKRWAELRPGASIQADKTIKDALKSITDLMFAHLQNSNFDTQIAESFLDLGIGTGALLVSKGTRANPFKFTSVPLSQLFLEEGADGKVGGSFRKFKVPARSVKEQWEDIEVSKDLADMIKEAPDKEITFIELTIPGRVQVIDRVSKQPTEIDGFKYFVIEENSRHIAVERDMRSNPWVVFRWATLPGEVWGRGPALIALPAIKTLNQQVKILLQAASIATLGMYTVADDGIINVDNIKLAGGALIPVSANAGSLQGPTLVPLNPPGSPQLAQLIIENQQSQINAMMFGDPLGDVTAPVKTATEISLRQQDLAKRIGSAFGKLQFELIAPLIKRLLDILDELGIIDLGPFTIDANNIAIEHISPLAQAQDEEDVIKHVRFAETIMGLFGPQVGLGLVPPDRFAQFLAKKLNVDDSVVITKEEAEQIREALAQQTQGAAPVEQV